MYIVGTAGHVDHGKSALVISLTGRDPDRLAEEQARGMTLDLGFAPLSLDGGIEAGIIDVPGHERFLHNMLAGAAGMDLLLLVVDALEGPRAQTIEHLHILGFLNVRSAIVVLTKTDIAGAAAIEAATTKIRQVCCGTVADGAQIIRVSNVTGEGIEQLRTAIHAALAVLPPRPSDAPAFMPVDRVFALSGRGTIVTGTLMQGTLEAGEPIVVQPSGLRVRIRSLQVFGRDVATATAGTRVAANLPGVDTQEISRGDVLAALEFVPVDSIAVLFTAASVDARALRRKMRVRVHAGSAEILGRLEFESIPAGGPIGAFPGTLRLAHPSVFYPGCRLVLRTVNPPELLGGAVVANFDDEATSSTRACLAVLAGAGLIPQTALRIASAANLVESEAIPELEELVKTGQAVELHKPVEYLSRKSFDGAIELARIELRERHRTAPWRLGCSTRELAAVMGVGEPLAARLLEAARSLHAIERRGTKWHKPGFAFELSEPQRRFIERTLVPDERAPLHPFALRDIESSAAAAGIAGFAEAMESLIAAGELIVVGDDVYLARQLARARALVEAALAAHREGVTMAQLRDAFGTTRRYALPLMEYFDSIGVTSRDGDVRRARSR